MNLKKFFTIENIHRVAIVGILCIYVVAALAYIENDTGYINVINHRLEIGKCFYREHYHIECPSCGLTRSFISIEDFNFSNALDYNKLGIPIYLLSMIVLMFNILSLMKVKIANQLGYVIAILGIIIAMLLGIFWVHKILSVGIYYEI